MGDIFRTVILISGRGSNMKAVVEESKRSEGKIVVSAVLSDKKSAKGLDFAREQGIETKVVGRKKGTSTLAEFNARLAAAAAAYKPDLIILAGFMRVLTAEFISLFPGRIINIHPSLLPSYKGLNVQQRAIDGGVKFSGCTVHFVTEEVDGGPIIAQAVVPVLAEDCSESLAARILKCEHRLLPAVVRGIANNKISLGGSVQKSTVVIGSECAAGKDEEFLISIK